MSRLCTTCHHVDRAAIDAALKAGVSSVAVAERYALVPMSVSRHKQNHLKEKRRPRRGVAAAMAVVLPSPPAAKRAAVVDVDDESTIVRDAIDGAMRLAQDPEIDPRARITAYSAAVRFAETHARLTGKQGNAAAPASNGKAVAPIAQRPPWEIDDVADADPMSRWQLPSDDEKDGGH